MSALQHSVQTPLPATFSRVLIGFLAFFLSLSCGLVNGEKDPADPVQRVDVVETPPDAQWQQLFTDAELSDFQVIGKAKFELSDGILLGSARDMSRNSFLASRQQYADFELEVELMINEGSNSGIQIRSHIDEPGNRVFGYQIEVDPSKRAWSGGLYDEGRRGWLNSLEGKEEARAAFKNGEWNHYRILCQGDHIQTWVNGIACADFHDDVDASGHLAFQVHSGKQADVKWRKARIREL